VDAASALLEAAGLDLKVETSDRVLKDYLGSNKGQRDLMTLLVSAVDQYRTRRQLAAELPQQVLNAGTSPSDLTISRHGFADGHACLSCLYPVRPQDTDRAAVIAGETGLSKREVLQLLDSKSPLGETLLNRIAETRGVEAEGYARYLGEPLDSFYNKEVCGGKAIETARGEAVAPLAFGSALAGFLLAASLTQPTEFEDRHFRIDFMLGLSTPMRRSPKPRPECHVCSREAFRLAYFERWGDARAHRTDSVRSTARADVQG
jgi:hypothetical protein